MLTCEENELVTRTGSGTPMGEAMRRYWIPALMSREVPEPDCPPVRVQLLGEPLVAFRDTQGRIGLLDEFCPHRLVSLWLGRNEESGLRCVYHGWKFDVAGTCVEQMNEPADCSFAHKIRTKAYPTVELGGVIWAYMGTRSTCRHRRASSGRRCQRAIAMSRKWWRSATGCRPWRVASTPRMRRSCIAPFPPLPPGLVSRCQGRLSAAGHRRWTSMSPTTDTAMPVCDRSNDGQTYVRTYHFVMPFTQIRPQQFRLQSERAQAQDCRALLGADR